MERPIQVKKGIILLYATLAIGFLRNVFFKYSPTLNEDVPKWAAILMSVVLLAIFIYLIVKSSNGKNWARLILLIIFILTILFTPIIIFTLIRIGVNLLGMPFIFLYIQILVNLIAMIFLFHPTSNAWFRYNKEISKSQAGSSL